MLEPFYNFPMVTKFGIIDIEDLLHLNWEDKWIILTPMASYINACEMCIGFNESTSTGIEPFALEKNYTTSKHITQLPYSAQVPIKGNCFPFMGVPFHDDTTILAFMMTIPVFSVKSNTVGYAT